MKKKVLILGGTKYVGKALVSELLSNHDYQVTILQRREIEGVNFIKGDRKDQILLLSIFKDRYDIVIDFICFCLPDAFKLIESIHKNNNQSKIIFVSTTYVYDENSKRNTYKELDFNPYEYNPSPLEREYLSYQEGKRSAEAYLVDNMNPEHLCVLRFPIILGANDYTLRTNFFVDYLKNGGKTSQVPTAGRSNFVFVEDIVDIFIELLENYKPGIYNAARPEYFSQYDLSKMYASILRIPKTSEHPENLESTPFFYQYDFMIDSSKLNGFFTFQDSFVDKLKASIDS